jgi:hypothetical protein
MFENASVTVNKLSRQERLTGLVLIGGLSGLGIEGWRRAFHNAQLIPEDPAGKMRLGEAVENRPLQFPSGQTMDLADWASTTRADHIALLFVHPECEPCVDLLKLVYSGDLTLGDDVTLVIPDDALGALEQAGLLCEDLSSRIILDQKSALRTSSGVPVSPTLLVMDRTNLRMTDAVLGKEEIENWLLDRHRLR